MNDQYIKALLVEDDPDQAELLQKALTPSTRFAMTHTERLSEAVQRLNQERFDVILLDLMLPDSQGLDTLDKAQAQASDVPIVVISNLKDEAVAVEAVCKGAQDYLVKGQLDGQMLSRTIRYAIERKRAEEMKDKFFSSVSHDLGSPLMVMQGYLELLLDGSYGELPKGAVKAMDSLTRTTNSMADLVKSLLDLGKIQSGRYVFSIESLDLKDLVNEILEEVLTLAKAKGLTLSKELNQDSFPMETDKSGLRRILYNLVGNAIKYTEHGGVKISVNSMAAGVGSPAGMVRIRVEDTGCGIEAYHLERVFDEFYQVDGSGSNTAPGTGLGLSICQRLVKLLGGEISVESEVGRGTVFTVVLPQKIDNRQLPCGMPYLLSLR